MQAWDDVKNTQCKWFKYWKYSFGMFSDKKSKIYFCRFIWSVVSNSLRFVSFLKIQSSYNLKTENQKYIWVDSFCIKTTTKTSIKYLIAL